VYNGAVRPGRPLLVLAPLLAACAATSPVIAGPAAGEPASPAPASLPAAARALLDAHNQLRARHCAPPLRWSATLARTAQAWADRLARRGCPLEHSGGALGENLASATPGALDHGGVVRLWYSEIARYRFARGGFSASTGHFTQLVWRGSSELGCGSSRCAELELWVCNYDPPGNVLGRFRENVAPTSCRR
jgi:uncharacterized protein YkwD